MKKRIPALLLALLLLFTAVACSSSGKNTAAAAQNMTNRDDGGTYEMAAPQAADAGYADVSQYKVVGESDFSPADDRKLIRRASLRVQTSAFDQSLANLDALIESTGAYVENRSISGYNPEYTYSQRNAEITVRVPAAQLDAFLAARDRLGSVLESNVWQDDVTMQFVDTEARLKSLRLKQERLLAILEKATELSDVIELETALSDTVYQIESYESSLKKLSNQVEYSAVSISLYEVARETAPTEMPKTLGERMTYQFARTMEATRTFLENSVIFIVAASPILILLLVALAVVLFRRRADRRKQATKISADVGRDTAEGAEETKDDTNT